MTKPDLPALNQRFGIEGHLSFKHGPGGLAIAEISNLYASANLFLQGAHLGSWTPRRQQPVIWLSPTAQFNEAKPIRGGVPVCWPWFASHPSEPNYPFHGIARTSIWEVIETAVMDDGGTCLRLSLTPNQAGKAVWPHLTPVEICFKIHNTLEIELVTRNLGSEPVTIGQALHTYFRVGNVKQIAIHCLDGYPYLDKLEGSQRKQQEGPVRIEGEVDRIYFDKGGDCQIEDPSLKRRIIISKQGSHSTVIWNPGAEKAAAIADMGETCYSNMVCVETANTAEDVVILAPGDEHKLSVRYSVENL